MLKACITLEPIARIFCTVLGGEWDYVILSTVRSLPPYMIEQHPSDGWCSQYMGFVVDRNQINVALTRARRGLIIVGELIVRMLIVKKCWFGYMFLCLEQRMCRMYESYICCLWTCFIQGMQSCYGVMLFGKNYWKLMKAKDAFWKEKNFHLHEVKLKSLPEF